MAKVNKTEVAVQLTEWEGLKHQINIADMKELLKAYNTKYSLEEVVKIWQSYNK